MDPHSTAIKRKPSNCIKFIFGFCGVGLNVTFAIYLAYVRVYGADFSRSVMLWMNASIYLAATCTVGMQMFFDQPFDDKYSTRITYTFRICMGLLVTAVTLFLIPFAASVAHVYLFGIFIGIFEGGPLSSLQQLAAVVSADMSKYVNSGFSIAQVLPIVLSLALGFYSADVSRLAALSFAWLPMLICLVGPLLFFTIVKQGNLDQAFACLDAPNERGGSGEGPDPRTESSPLLQEPGKGSTWSHPHVFGCAVMQVVTYMLAMFLMPFFTFFGTAELAHILVLARFGAELFGRLVSHLWGFEWWGVTDGNIVLMLLGLLVGVRVVVLSVLLLHVFSVIHLSTSVICGLVVVFYSLFAWTQSELMASVIERGPSNQEGVIARGMMFLCFAAQLLALGLSIPCIELRAEAL